MFLLSGNHSFSCRNGNITWDLILALDVMCYPLFKGKNGLKTAFGLLFDKSYGKRAGSGSTARYMLQSGVF